MNESRLTDLLERAATQTPATPPPLDAIRTGATRRKRRRTAWAAAGTALAVATVIAGTTALTGGPAPVDRPPVAAEPTRLVGIGHIAISVPKEWPTNKIRCGTPTEDSVIVDPSYQGFCQFAQPDGVESVEFRPLPETPGRQNAEIDGLPVAKIPSACTMVGSLTGAKVNFCSASLQFLTLGLTITATVQGEGMDPEERLRQVRLVSDLSGVPGFRWLGEKRPQAEYLSALKRYRLVAKVVSRPAGNWHKGAVIGVSPAPGTMLPIGSTVTVTVAQ